MDPLNATIVDTTFDVYDLLNDQCDEPLPKEFEDAYGTPRSLLFFALVAIPVLLTLEVTLNGKGRVSAAFAALKVRMETKLGISKDEEPPESQAGA